MDQRSPASPPISRVMRSRAAARRSYDRLSPWYDILASSERPFAEAGAACLAPMAGESILEIGYGTGWLLPSLALAVGPNGRVYGIDLSAGMRAVAGRRLQAAGLSGRVELVTGDASTLPFGSGCMNAVFMSYTLELFDTPEIPLVLEQCKRVLVDGGRICVVALAMREPAGLALRIYGWAHEHFPALVDCRPILVRESLEASGFSIRSIDHRNTWGLPVEICLATK